MKKTRGESMFWLKSKREELSVGNVAEKVAIEAEGFYRAGKMHCAEAVLMAIKNNYRPDVPDAVLQMASGFGGGSGSGCICGAVSGGTIALGLVLQENKKRVIELTRELHAWFKAEYGVTCCKVIAAKGKSGCPLITGRVAGKVAELLD
jgi:C_GCAxxG_C_C family probable redox protein